MKLVVIESPLAGNFPLNQRYARWCMLDSFRRGEQPFASHLLYTQVLDDEVPGEREAGIAAGLAWAKAAGAGHVFYVDLCEQCDAGEGVYAHCVGQFVRLSSGMLRAWPLGGGELRSLEERSPDFWEAFLRGEETKKTRGSWPEVRGL